MPRMATGFADATRPHLEAQFDPGDERYKLKMMQGGPSLFGGQELADGALALAEWLAAAHPRADRRVATID